MSELIGIPQSIAIGAVAGVIAESAALRYEKPHLEISKSQLLKDLLVNVTSMALSASVDSVINPDTLPGFSIGFVTGAYLRALGDELIKSASVNLNGKLKNLSSVVNQTINGIGGVLEFFAGEDPLPYLPSPYFETPMLMYPFDTEILFDNETFEEPPIAEIIERQESCIGEWNNWGVAYNEDGVPKDYKLSKFLNNN